MRVVIAEDSVLLREGLTRLLKEAEIAVVAAVADGEGLLRAVAEHQPDLCVVDVRMPPTHTDEELRAALVVRSRWPVVAVLVLSQYVEERYATELLAANSSGVGYLLKERVADVTEFVDALHRVAGGGTALDPEVVSQLFARSRRPDPLGALSPREVEVLELMAEGRSNGGIAAALVVSAGAVEKHVGNIFTKLDLPQDEGDNRRVLAVPALPEGMIMVMTELDHESAKPPLSPGRRIALVLGGLIAAAVIVCGGFGIYNLLTPVTTKQDQIRLPIEQAKLSLDVGSGDVSLRRGSGTEVVVDRTLRYRTTEPRAVERSGADGIRIEADCIGVFNWNCEVSYDITLPDGFDLDLAASSGTLTARDLAVRTLRHDASSGDVELVGVTGPVDLRVSSGTITADRLISDDVYIEASSGDVDLDFATAPRKVVADVSSGRIEIGLPDGKYNVDVDVDSGEQRVDVPVDTTSDRLIQARASSGDIEIDRNGR